MVNQYYIKKTNEITYYSSDKINSIVMIVVM